MRITSLMVTVAILLIAVGPLSAATFDFESTAATVGGSGTYHTLALSNGGVTLTLSRVSNTGFDVSDNTTFPDLGLNVPPSWGSRSLSGGLLAPSSNAFIGTLGQTQNHVELQFGDFGQDADSIVLTGYSGVNGTGSVLAVQTMNYSAVKTLPGDIGKIAIDAAGIQSFTFGSTASDSTQNSLYYDNFIVSVPEPSLALSVVAAVAFLRRRRAVRRQCLQSCEAAA